MSRHVQNVIVDMVQAGMKPKEVVGFLFDPQRLYFVGTMTPAEVERGAAYVEKQLLAKGPPEPIEPATIGDERADLVEWRRGARTWRYGMEFAP